MRPTQLAAAVTVSALFLASAAGAQTRVEPHPELAVHGERMPEEARRVLDRAAAAYRSLESYQDRFTLRAAGSGDPDARVGGSTAYTLRYSRAHGVRMLYDQGGGRTLELIANWDRVWVVWPGGAQYIEDQYPEDIAATLNAYDSYLAYLAQHPVASVLLRQPRGADDYFRSPISISEVRSEALGGAQGSRLVGTVDQTADGGGVSRISMWFSDETGLLGEVLWAAGEGGGQPGGRRAGLARADRRSSHQRAAGRWGVHAR